MPIVICALSPDVICQMDLSQRLAIEPFLRRLVRVPRTGKDSGLNRAQELIRRRSRQSSVQKSLDETLVWQTNQNEAWAGVPRRISVHLKADVISLPRPNHERNQGAPGHPKPVAICPLILNHEGVQIVSANLEDEV
jgi:hypothetical protein